MRLLLLEDQPVLAEAISSHLKSQGFTIDTISSLREAELALQIGEFSAALFDLSLPDGDGLTLLRSVRKRGSRLPIIIMTARDQISDRIKGLESGADDYLVKPFDLNELVARLHAVLRRYEGNPSPVLKIGKFEIDQNQHRILSNGEDLQLTAKEWALIIKLIAKPNAVVRKEQLEEALYNFDDEIVSNTLEVYVSRLRKKLGKNSIETIRGLGYRFVGEKS
ncbi:response regulator transcription factor [Azonexus sp.]|uniref:response regulator n=1 Tax=Azonexus sp. TaxID=1872668 RepID=UPI0027B93384|nr:response regulator transcription factor [Azonexus sp.]